MAILTNNLVLPKGSLKKDGVTFYKRNGQTVMRSATTEQPRRNSRNQFVARQRLANNMGLWKALLEATKPLLTGGKSNYGRFCTLMRKMPVVFLTRDERRRGASLMLPGMPVSDGMLPDIEYRLGEVDGCPALLTSLRVSKHSATLVGALFGRGADLKNSDRLDLYRLEQQQGVQGESLPKVRARVETLTNADSENPQPFRDIELREVHGRLALVGEVFGDEMKGWALVRRDAEDLRVSSQRIVTPCRLYEQYTTEEALQRSAESYGGLTFSPYLTPDGE